MVSESAQTVLGTKGVALSAPCLCLVNIMSVTPAHPSLPSQMREKLKLHVLGGGWASREGGEQESGMHSPSSQLASRSERGLILSVGRALPQTHPRTSVAMTAPRIASNTLPGRLISCWGPFCLTNSGDALSGPTGVLLPGPRLGAGKGGRQCETQLSGSSSPFHTDSNCP